MKNHLVSIIIPCYNAQKFIARTIISVQEQTYTNWEIIIVDDCSNDQTVSIIEQIAVKEPRILLLKLKVNAGTGVARNLALSKATGQYIAFLDADDLWKNNKLEKQLAFMTIHNLAFTFSFYDCIDENNGSLNKIVKAPLKLTYLQLFFCNYIGNLTAIYDTSFFGKIPINTTRKRQDWMLWLTILKQIKFAKPIPESLAYYRVTENSLSASKINLLKHNFNIYTDFHGFNKLKAMLCMLVFLFNQIIIKPIYIKKLK